MTRTAVILLLAVLLPSVGLGWLALRSAKEQQIILEKRTVELYQIETEAVAAAARALVQEQRRAFADVVQRLLADGNAQRIADDFTAALAAAWPQKAVGFALGRDGRLLCPTARDATARVECEQFLWNNGAFLGNKMVATVYPVTSEQLSRPEALRKGRSSPVSQQGPFLSKVAPPQPRTDLGEGQQQQQKAAPAHEAGVLVMQDAPANRKTEGQSRNVAPQQAPSGSESGNISQLMLATAGFRELTGIGDEGMINRFVQDRLNMIFWLRRDEAREFIFGCLIEAEDLQKIWRAAFEDDVRSSISNLERPDFILALLDDKGRPVATRPDGASIRDWKKPFVASEIGESLPHWEAALYLAQPQRLRDSARSIRQTLYLLIAAALIAIGFGVWMVAAETRRQLALAQKKTDFVSNVSHELKTPLTSIRMFAELMQRGGVAPEKREQYLRIIMVETERLTRLINNVLDFARLDRRGKPLRKRPLDLYAVVARVWEVHELHLRESGFHTAWEAATPPYPVLGDSDALAQVLVNLLSNAEKYSTHAKDILLRTWVDGDAAYLSVLDRGCGVPPGEEAKIFQPFHRAHDSLSSGVQGTGLGLTLAQQLVREQRGEIIYRERVGGGSEFTVQLPLASDLRPA